jgi:hypothetical protein
MRVKWVLVWPGVVFFLAAVVSWVWSGLGNHSYDIGERVSVRVDFDCIKVTVADDWRLRHPDRLDDHFWFDWGAATLYTPSSNPVVVRWFAVPLWPFAVLPLLPIVIGLRLNAVTRRRRRQGLCIRCRYDRRGIDSAKVCPECGSDQSE